MHGKRESITVLGIMCRMVPIGSMDKELYLYDMLNRAYLFALACSKRNRSRQLDWFPGEIVYRQGQEGLGNPRGVEQGNGQRKGDRSDELFFCGNACCHGLFKGKRCCN